MLTSFSSTASPNTLYFRGKHKQNEPAAEESKAIQLPNQADEVLLQTSEQAVVSPESRETSTILEKMLSGWGLRSQPTEKKVTFEPQDESNPEPSAGPKVAPSGSISDWKNSFSRFYIPSLRITSPSGKRIKKKAPGQKTGEGSGSPLSKTKSRDQAAQNKTVLTSIQENDDDSILQHSIPNIAAPLNQLLTPPPQLPSALEDLTAFANRESKTPASSLWVQGTTGYQSRVSSSCTPSRSQELQEETDEYSDAESEDVPSDSSSAFLVDDDQEVLQERENRASRKWAKAVKNQKLGSFIAQKIPKPDIHQNSRYLDGDSDLDSDDQALYYDSDDGFADSDSENGSIKSVIRKPQPHPESLLTKTIQDPKFNLVTQHQQITKESNARIAEAVATQHKNHNEQRIHDLQKHYSLEQLADNQQKLQIRLGQIHLQKQNFITGLKIPKNLSSQNISLADQLNIWQNVLNNLKFETTQQLEAVASASRKGKQTQETASTHWNALMEKRQKIELKQQRLDSAMGLYNDLEANEAQIRSRISLYHEAIARTKHQALMSQLTQAAETGQDNDQMVQHWQNLGHLHSSSALKQAKREVLAKNDADATLKLQILDQALKFQDAMVNNICTRLKHPPVESPKKEALAQHLSNEFTKTELREAFHSLSRQQDLNLTQNHSILNLAFTLPPEK